MDLSRCLVFLVLSVVLMVSACERMVDVPLPPHESQLVAQGFFTPNGPWVVRVSRTVGYSDAADPEFVDDATVEIWEGERRLAQLARADTGTYVASSPVPVSDTQYTLYVTAPGYAATEGHAALPPSVVAPRFAETHEVPSDPAYSLRQVSHVELTVEDPGGVPNYYSLFIVHVRWQEDKRTGHLRPLPPSLFGFESDDPALGPSPLDFLNTEKTYYLDALFTDEVFDGQTYVLDFDFQYDLPDETAPVATRRAFAVVLLSVSESFHHYWKTASEQAIAGNNPFAEPLRVYSNMTSGFGVFAGYRAYIFPLQGSSIPVVQEGLGYLCTQIQLSLLICPVLTDAALPFEGWNDE